MVAQSDGFGYSGQFPAGQYPNPSGHALQVIWSVLANQFFICDGNIWQPLESTIVVACGGIPVGAPSSGTMGANGALTLNTALPFIIPNCYMVFPAGAVFTGSAAGNYFVKMSSTTQATVYTNVQNSFPASGGLGGVPRIPSILVPVVDPGPGAYVQTTGSTLVLCDHAVPAGMLGPTGTARTRGAYSYSNSGNNKLLLTFWNGLTGTNLTVSATQYNSTVRVITNTGVTNAQASEAQGNVSYGAVANAGDIKMYSATDTQGFNINFRFAANLASATDFQFLMNSTVEVSYGA